MTSYIYSPPPSEKHLQRGQFTQFNCHSHPVVFCKDVKQKRGKMKTTLVARQKYQEGVRWGAVVIFGVCQTCG